MSGLEYGCQFIGRYRRDILTPTPLNDSYLFTLIHWI
jgi:hypothetical protein